MHALFKNFAVNYILVILRYIPIKRAACRMFHYNIICCLYLLYVQFFGRSRSRMELSYFISLILISALNVLFFFSGICLNSVVILSFWRSAQLRKKLCYFMIMVLSCCDLLEVLSSHPFLTLLAMSCMLTGKIYPYKWMDIPLTLSSEFVCLSLLALLVMNFDRYLATYHPIFHRTSVTKGKLLTLLAILSIGALPLLLLASSNVISHQVGLLVSCIILAPPMVFMNYKLFTIARKSRRNKGTSPEMKMTFSLKNVSSCLLSVICFVVLSIPVFVYIGLSINSKETIFDVSKFYILGLWTRTIASFNSTFNCLIFYWKNKILRTEGMKVIKGMKICRRV